VTLARPGERGELELPRIALLAVGPAADAAGDLVESLERQAGGDPVAIERVSLTWIAQNLQSCDVCWIHA